MSLWRGTDTSGGRGAAMTDHPLGDLQIYRDMPALVKAGAEHVVALAQTAIANQGRFTVALSGGSTPRPLYALLASPAYADRLDWSRVFVFWGDERCVSPDHPDSNYRMARETLLDQVPIPQDHIFRMRGELDPAEAAADYERVLRAFFEMRETAEGAVPCFDLLLQGMGSDGHTASLFPGTEALRERIRWVAANHVEKLGAWRITLTLPVINAAANATFLVAGSDKAAALREVLQGPRQPELYPSQGVQPVNGTLRWLVDENAAALLGT